MLLPVLTGIAYVDVLFILGERNRFLKPTSIGENYELTLAVFVHDEISFEPPKNCLWYGLGLNALDRDVVLRRSFVLIVLVFFPFWWRVAFSR